MIVKSSAVPIALAEIARQRDQYERIYRAAVALAPAISAALPVVRAALPVAAALAPAVCAALPAVRAVLPIAARAAASASAVSAIVDRIRNNTYQPRSFHNVD